MNIQDIVNGATDDPEKRIRLYCELLDYLNENSQSKVGPIWVKLSLEGRDIKFNLKKDDNLN